jgi:hypothetical protein
MGRRGKEEGMTISEGDEVGRERGEMREGKGKEEGEKESRGTE